MNPVLEQVCQRFGATSCANASLMDVIFIFFATALAGVLATWMFGKLVASD